MEKSIAVSGNSGPKVRSDCEITLELKTSGGINIDLTSKVKITLWRINNRAHKRCT